MYLNCAFKKYLYWKIIKSWICKAAKLKSVFNLLPIKFQSFNHNLAVLFFCRIRSYLFPCFVIRSEFVARFLWNFKWKASAEDGNTIENSSRVNSNSNYNSNLMPIKIGSKNKTMFCGLSEHSDNQALILPGAILVILTITYSWSQKFDFQKSLNFLKLFGKTRSKYHKLLLLIKT